MFAATKDWMELLRHAWRIDTNWPHFSLLWFRGGKIGTVDNISPAVAIYAKFYGRFSIFALILNHISFSRLSKRYLYGRFFRRNPCNFLSLHQHRFFYNVWLLCWAFLLSNFEQVFSNLVRKKFSITRLNYCRFQ